MSNSEEIPCSSKTADALEILRFTASRDGGDVEKILRSIEIDPIVALIDMDCFYVQVELRLAPEFRGKPAGVVQYLTRFKGGSLIAVSYEARAHGVKRSFKAEEAKAKCPDMKIFAVPELNGKADLTRYREAGAEVIQVLNKSFSVVERASIDEAYIDLTPEVKALLPKYITGELTLTVEELGATCVVGRDSTEAWLNQLNIGRETLGPSVASATSLINNLAGAIAAKLINKLRSDVLNDTEFHCSAGISYSKTLCKLACGMNKPQKQTVLPHDAVMDLFEKTEIKDVRMLGGKLGDQIVDYLGITYMGELCRVPRMKLLRFFEPKTADWLQNLAYGKDNEAVEPRQLPKSIGCSKNFLGRAALKTRDDIKKWMAHFSEELSQRLKKDQGDNGRTATLLTVHMTFTENNERKSISRCCPLSSYESTDLAKDGFLVADKCMTSLGFQSGMYTRHLISMGIVASKMKDGKGNVNRIESYFFGSKTKSERALMESDANAESSRESTPELFDAQNADESRSPDKDKAKAEVEVEEVEDLQVISISSSVKKTESPSENQLPKWKTVQDDKVPGPSIKLIVENDIEIVEPQQKNDFDGTGSRDTGKFKAYNCLKCKNFVWCPLMEQEHNDYHLALELSRSEDNRDPSVPRKKLKLSDKPIKPKPKTKKAEPPVMTIDRYFKKKPA